MSGRFLGLVIVVAALLAGVSIYYLQVYAFYEELPAGAVEIRLTSAVSGAPEPVLAADVRAIDAASSPLRFRACFALPLERDALAAMFARYPDPVPLTGPGWFDCYDAVAIGAALEAGEAIAFLSQSDIRDGVDRVVAVYPDGRAYAWHQLNETYE